MMFHPSMILYRKLQCYNHISAGYSYENDAMWCCGSFIYYFTIALFLTIMFFNTYGRNRIIFGITIIFIWVLLVIIDPYYDSDTTEQKICNKFFHHAINFAFGIFTGLLVVILENK